jgi:uncharacterized membrane protein YdjX (TVP38/TMEM64 family)
MENKKEKIIQVTVLLIFVGILVALTIWVLPLFNGLTTPEGRMEFKDTIENLGTKGVFAILGLMITQILLPVLPGEPVELIAGMCYGTINGALIVTLGAFISGTIIFFAVRKFGRKFIYTFVSKEKMDTLEHSKWFNNPQKMEAIFLILFLLPGVPKDLLVFIGGLLPVKASHFLAISTLARVPAVLMLTAIGGNILNGDWINMVGVLGIAVAVTVILVAIVSKTGKISKEEIQ